MHRVTAEINLAALRHNATWIKKRIGDKAKILAMVKCNAYGHGAEKVAQAIFDRVDALGVTNIDEAVFLRNAKISTPIVVMQGFIDQDELSLFDQYKLESVVHNTEQLELLEKVRLKNPLTVWCKIDTGLRRLGFSAHDFEKIYPALQNNPNIRKPLRFITHFSDAGDISKSETIEQYRSFTDTLKSSVKDFAEVSMSNSAAILNWPEITNDWARPGILLYGISPIKHKNGLDLGLMPAMTLKSRIIAIRDVKKGDKIGYGGIFVCEKPMRIGVIAIGYGSGYARLTKNGAPILINGKICHLVGRVSMDMLCVDLKNALNVKIGDEAILWGKDLPIEKVAPFAGTIPYELITHLTARVKTIHVAQG